MDRTENERTAAPADLTDQHIAEAQMIEDKELDRRLKKWQIRDAKFRVGQFWVPALNIAAVVIVFFALRHTIEREADETRHQQEQARKADEKERQEAAKSYYASVRMHPSYAALGGNKYWLDGKLVLVNHSKRANTPLYITWRLIRPPTSRNPDPIYKQKTDFGGLDRDNLGFSELYPGQESERPGLFLVETESPANAVLVQADVVFETTREGDECMFDEPLPPGGSPIEQLKSFQEALDKQKLEPKLCVRDAAIKDKKVCTKDQEKSCTMESVEQLVELRPTQGAPDGAKRKDPASGRTL